MMCPRVRRFLPPNLRPFAKIMLALAASLLTLFAAAGADSGPGRYFTITVVDEQTGRGVPLVELQTVNNIRLFSDSNGIVAFDEPGLENQSVFFHVKAERFITLT